MKKVKIILGALGIIIGLTLIFSASIMFDTKTKFPVTAFIMIMLGFTVTILSIAFCAIYWED